MSINMISYACMAADEVPTDRILELSFGRRASFTANDTNEIQLLIREAAKMLSRSRRRDLFLQFLSFE